MMSTLTSTLTLTLTSTLTSTPSIPPPPADTTINLAAHYLATYRSIFYDALHTDQVQPFLIPFCLVGSFLLPIAYLCIPQYSVVATTTIGVTGEKQQVRIRREWIHRLRWVVGAVLVWWNLGVVVGLPGFGGGLGSTEERENGMGGTGPERGWFTAGKTTASACTALAYAAGLMCGWGTIWGLETVVFGGYQGVAMRVRRRVRRSGKGVDGKGVEGELKNGFVNGNRNTDISGNGNGRLESKSEQSGYIEKGSWDTDTAADLRRRRNLNNGSGELADAKPGKVALATCTTETQSPGEHEEKGKRWTVDETIDLDKYEYYWEPYPDNGTVWERLDWVMDMFNSFRGAGWTYSISSIPSLPPPVIPPLPESILTSSSPSPSQILPYFPHGLPISPVSFANLPLSTTQHFHRPTTTRSFLLSRLLSITLSYLALDFFTVSARLDPYFILGPNGPLLHPTYLSSLASSSSSSSSSSPSVLPPLSLACARLLASLPPWGLNFARSLFSLGGVLSGLFLSSYAWQLTQFFVLGRWLGYDNHGMGILDELWRYPSLFGGLVNNVLDRGLAGFWGGWWHQSFRVGFTGPVRYFVVRLVDGAAAASGGGGGTKSRKGNKKTVATLQMAVAFLLSGVLHALGGWTCTAFRINSHGEDLMTGENRNRLVGFAEPVGFFVSQFLGCVVQAFLVVLVNKSVTPTRELPRWLKRTGNGLFVLVWLHGTRWMLIDDMTRSGLFLYEPVPVSVFRLLGLGGMPGEGRGDWWRLDWEYVPSLWVGGGSSRWWEKGFRM